MSKFKKVLNIAKISNAQERNGFIIIICGISIISAILISQYLFLLSYLNNNNNIENKLVISDNEFKLKSINNVSLSTFFILLFGLTLVLAGIRSIFKAIVDRNLVDLNTINFKIQNNFFYYKLKKAMAKNIVLLSSLFYFILLSSLSNTIIYRPFSSFSEIYQIHVPSWNIIGCCGLPGYYPVLSIFLTEHLGLLLIPINLILSSLLSLLIGFNIFLIINKIQRTNVKNKMDKTQRCIIQRKKNSTFLSLGALIGLFVECPVCAGSFFIYLFGGNLATAGLSTIFANEIQPFFVIVSFILLIIPLFIIRTNKF